MTPYVAGETIKALREKNSLTQKQLAQQLTVSDKTVSKWETGRGLPDITLLQPLSAALGVSVTELVTGEVAVNKNRAGNMLKTGFYVCPVCGNVICSGGQGAFSCCGISLPRLEGETPDGEHDIKAVRDDGEWYVTVEHPMEREHYISFIAAVSADRVQLVRLYPQQDAAARLRICGPGKVFAYCNRHGLFEMKLK